MSLFDDEFDDIVKDGDNIDVPTGLGFNTLSKYQENGEIRKGNMIIAPEVNELPGFVNVMNEMFGKDRSCSHSVRFMDLQKQSFIYEMNCYAKKEKESGKELFGGKKEEWIVSDIIIDNTWEEFEPFANRIIAKNSLDIFPIFARCSVTNSYSDNIEKGDEGIIFLGEYELDKAASLYHRRIVLHLVNDVYYFPQTNK